LRDRSRGTLTASRRARSRVGQPCSGSDRGNLCIPGYSDFKAVLACARLRPRSRSTHDPPRHHRPRRLRGRPVGAVELIRGLPEICRRRCSWSSTPRRTTRACLPQILRARDRCRRCSPSTTRRSTTGRIYVAPPDHHLTLKRRHVRVTRGPSENGFRPAIDPLFRTAAQVHGPRVIGVVLSGGLNDGTHGLARIVAHGGIAIVQDPQEALVPSMPLSAIQAVEVHHVLKAADLGPRSSRRVREPIPAAHAGDRRDRPTSPRSATASSVHAPPARPSPYTCPECGGALWEAEDEAPGCCGSAATSATPSPPRRCCREQDANLDNALWTALRALEEHASLYRRMAERGPTGPGSPTSPAATPPAPRSVEAERPHHPQRHPREGLCRTPPAAEPRHDHAHAPASRSPNPSTRTPSPRGGAARASEPEGEGPRPRARRSRWSGSARARAGSRRSRRSCDGLPVDLGVAFVFVAHAGAGPARAATAAALARHTQMPVVEVTEADPIAPNHVYVAPPELARVLADQHVDPGPPPGEPHGTPIDRCSPRWRSTVRTARSAWSCRAPGPTACSACARSRASAASRSSRTRTAPATRACRAPRSRPAWSTSCARPRSIAEELQRLGRHPYVRRPPRAGRRRARDPPRAAAPRLRAAAQRQRRRLHPLQAADDPPPAAAAHGPAQARQRRAVHQVHAREPGRGHASCIRTC
jgi:two-component system chemotaxis response regulator CheB